jgi:UDP-N-acetylglucosamine:LPS N-acetylglucosamine transferase
MSTPPERLLLVACSGGHLLQLLALESAWQDEQRVWVTLPTPDAKALLEAEQVIYAHGPTPRSLVNLLLNLHLACRVVRRCKPTAIISTGAGLAVPFFIVGRLHHLRLIYVESFTRTRKLSLSGRIVYPLADSFFVQWPLECAPRRAIYAGSVV